MTDRPPTMPPQPERDAWRLTHSCGGERRELVATRRPGSDQHEILCVDCGQWATLVVTQDREPPGRGVVVEAAHEPDTFKGPAGADYIPPSRDSRG